MTLATRHFSISDYLQYSGTTDIPHELVNGELVPMTLGMGQHGEIIDFTTICIRHAIQQLSRDWVAKPMMIGIQSPRGERWDTVRIPDVVVLPRAQWRHLQDREAIIRLNEPPPCLVVEVVSESTKGTDYRAKRAEYSVLDIPEYWILDPLLAKVTVLVLNDGWYDAIELTGADVMQSPTFPGLTQIVEQLLRGDL